MQFRKATKRDLDRLVEIHAAAYPDARSEEARRRNFTMNPFGGLDRLVVAVDGGDVVAHAFLFEIDTWFGGAPVRMGGVASVGVAPEARGRGVATALMRHLHAASERRGDALTMLHAFRQGFYARLGYAPASSRKRLAIDTRSVPSSWLALARGRVRAARGADRAAMLRVYARAAERASGWLARSGTFWDGIFARQRRVTLVCERPVGTKERRRLTGYVAFTLLQEEPHARALLEVDEVVSDDDESRRALIGALAAMRDQVSEILLELPESDPFERALVDPDGRRSGTAAVEHSLGELVGGPMVRVEDVPRAIEARGYVASGAFDLVLRDVEPSAFGVRVRGGRAKVEPARTEAGALETTRAGLAAIFFGGLSAAGAVALGLADADPAVAERVDAIVRLPPVCPVDAF